MQLQILRPLALPLGFGTLLSLGLAFGRRAPQGEELEVSVHAVAGSVSYLVSEGVGNVGLSVGEDGLLMIDSQTAAHAPKIAEALARLSNKRPAYLVNTHWHGDHTGGNPHFGGAAAIVAHENVRRRLGGDESIGGRVADEVQPAGLPEITHANGLALHFNGETIRVLYFPSAHTDGDSVVWFTRANVVHMGDLFFQLGYPFIDLDSGGSVDGLIDAVKRVLDEIPADAKIIPGHGELTDVGGLREYVAMLEQLRDRVQTGLAAGKSAEDLLAAGITAEFDARWGGFAFVPPEKFVRTLVRGLSAR